MTDENVVQFEKIHHHKQRGFFSLGQLEPRESVERSTRSCGWWEFDQIWKIYPGQFTVVTGIPGHGKSTFLFNLMIQLWRTHAVRSMLYVPENERYLLHTLREIWGDQSDWERFIDTECFVQSAMPEHYTDEPKDLAWVLDQAVYGIREHECGLIIIDPWNELEHAKPATMPMTDYIRLCLLYLKQFARINAASVILVAHPTKAVAENGGRTPLLSDIEGSMSWYNKCDNGLIVVRDFEKSSAKIISAKVRERGAGKVGCCYFNVDPDTGIFSPQYGAVT